MVPATDKNRSRDYSAIRGQKNCQMLPKGKKHCRNNVYDPCTILGPGNSGVCGETMAAANKPNMGQVMAVMGTVLMLARSSELHAGYRVAQLVDRTRPSILRGHFCLYTERKTGKPVGFCNWARVSQEVLDELLEQRYQKYRNIGA